MTELEAARARPEFESTDLGIDVDETHRRIEAAMRGLSTAETTEGRKYRTSDGMLVAIVGSRSDENGDATARLVYRTAPASEPATRKATKLFETLESYATDQ